MIPWLQSLLTFRKSGGSGFQVPELDSNGRIRVSLLSESPMVVGTTPPAILDGSVLWYNTTLNVLMYYDVARAKWLALDKTTLTGGRNGNTGQGSFYRGPDSVVMDPSLKGFPVSKGTVTSISWSKSDNNNATLEVLVNGSAVTELNHTTTGAVRNNAVNADFSDGIMSFRNKSGLGDTSNAFITVEYRRRV